MKKINKLLVILVMSTLLQACAQKEKAKIVYVMAPHCGWCYGNSKNIAKISNQFNKHFEFEVLVGGMWLNEDALKGSETLHQFVKSHIPSITKFTGEVIGDKYLELTKDSTYTFNGLEPSAAINLVKELQPEKAFVFSQEVLKANFIDGKKLDKIETYIPILKKMAIDSKKFKKQWMTSDNITKTKKEFTKTDTLANGFPALVLIENKKITVLSSGAFKLEPMIEKIEKLMTK